MALKSLFRLASAVVALMCCTAVSPALAAWSHDPNAVGLMVSNSGNSEDIVPHCVIPDGAGGSIINVSSLTAEFGRPSVVPYTASKGGVRQLTRGLAVELAPDAIRVNAIAPGYFTTEMNRALLDNPDFVAWVNLRTPMKRWGDPDELAGAVVFLASDAAAFITGQTITVDGGMVMS